MHGNEFIYTSLGPNAERRNSHFKAFFATQYQVIDPPKRNIFPNWKVHPMITWPNYICALIWLLELVFSVDEMIMGFKGRHKDKKWITYKAESDGFCWRYPRSKIGTRTVANKGILRGINGRWTGMITQ